MKDPLGLDTNCTCWEHEKMRIAETRGVLIGVEIAYMIYEGKAAAVDEETVATVRQKVIETTAAHGGRPTLNLVRKTED